MKVCTVCRESKPPDEFSPNKTGKDGLHTWCRTCKAASARRWHGANREQRRQYDAEAYAANREQGKAQARQWHANNRARSLDNKRRWKLALHGGFTDADKRALFDEQDGRCAICRGLCEIDKLCVDHCHSTLVNRGLLCKPCNIGLGHFADSPERLRRAADYLERTTARKSA